MKNNYGLWSLIMISMLFSLACSNNENIGTVFNQSVSEFKNTMNKKGATLVDIRTPEEFKAGHIPGAIMVDWKKRSFRNYILNIPQDKPVLIYCRSGNRSAKAADAMQALGFEEIYNLEKGFKQWKAENQAITTEDNEANIVFQHKAETTTNDVEAAIAKMTKKGMGSIKNLSSADFQKAMNMPDAILVDVRTPAEFAEGHLPGAQNIDWKQRSFRQLIIELDKKKPVLIYCRSGNRSGKAASTMQALGFKNIYNLDKGIKDWKAHNLPIQS